MANLDLEAGFDHRVDEVRLVGDVEVHRWGEILPRAARTKQPVAVFEGLARRTVVECVAVDVDGEAQRRQRAHGGNGLRVFAADRSDCEVGACPAVAGSGEWHESSVAVGGVEGDGGRRRRRHRAEVVDGEREQADTPSDDDVVGDVQLEFGCSDHLDACRLRIGVGDIAFAGIVDHGVDADAPERSDRHPVRNSQRAERAIGGRACGSVALQRGIIVDRGARPVGAGPRDLRCARRKSEIDGDDPARIDDADVVDVDVERKEFPDRGGRGSGDLADEIRRPDHLEADPGAVREINDAFARRGDARRDPCPGVGVAGDECFEAQRGKRTGSRNGEDGGAHEVPDVGDTGPPLTGEGTANETRAGIDDQRRSARRSEAADVGDGDLDCPDVTDVSGSAVGEVDQGELEIDAQRGHRQAGGIVV